MLVDQYGKPLKDEPINPVSFYLMRSLLDAAMKRSPPSPAAQVRQVARECARDWPEEPKTTIKFRQIAKVYG